MATIAAVSTNLPLEPRANSAVKLPKRTVQDPVFLVGAPRSGTTLIFEVLASHPDLGWLTTWHNRIPSLTFLSAAARLCSLGPAFRKRVRRSDQWKTPLDYVRQGPSEAYGIWGQYLGNTFESDYLLENRASDKQKNGLIDEFAKVLAYQGKPRLAVKTTGPSRMRFLQDIFPEARFVHIIRDGRAVVNSLMKVDFWVDTHRLESPAWSHGMPDSYIEEWKRLEESPLALAALQWRNIVETARRECLSLPDIPYLEIRYEDFMANPGATIVRILDFAELEASPAIESFIAARVNFKNMNLQYLEDFDENELAMLENLLGDLLADLGYSSSPAS